MNLDRGNTAPFACVLRSSSLRLRTNRWLAGLGLLPALAAWSEQDLHETNLCRAGAAVFPAPRAPRNDFAG
jgi:hypothetical protein